MTIRKPNQQRLDDIAAGVSLGYSYTDLAKRWSVSHAAAWMWCERYATPAQRSALAKNHKPEPAPRAPYQFAKPKFAVWSAKPKAANQACLHVLYANGKPFECGEPTDGKNYCPPCQSVLSSGPVGSRYSLSLGNRSYAA